MCVFVYIAFITLFYISLQYTLVITRSLYNWYGTNLVLQRDFLAPNWGIVVRMGLLKRVDFRRQNWRNFQVNVRPFYLLMKMCLQFGFKIQNLQIFGGIYAATNVTIMFSNWVRYAMFIHTLVCVITMNITYLAVKVLQFLVFCVKFYKLLMMQVAKHFVSAIINHPFPKYTVIGTLHSPVWI